MSNIYPQVNLGDLISLEYGKPLPEADRASSSEIPAYGANGILCWSTKAYRDVPSIIVGRKGSAGEVNLTEGPFWPTDVTYFIEHDAKQTELKFLYYLLKHLNLPRLAKGIKPGINRNEVYAIKVPCHSLVDQKRIVAILDDAFENLDRAITNTQTCCQLASSVPANLRALAANGKLSEIWRTHNSDVEPAVNALRRSRASRGILFSDVK